MSFLALCATLSGKQAAGRMRVWRALRSQGAATLRDGVYLLPAADAHASTFEEIAGLARSAGGTADIYRLHGRDEAQHASLLALFDRAGEYAVLVEAIHAADPSDTRLVRTLRRNFLALSAIDFFPHDARRQAEAALADLEARASGEPRQAAGSIRPLQLAEYQGRIWATRQHLWIDRMASAWMIRRFIDRQAQFLWLDAPDRCPEHALGFDFDGAAFTHVEGLVTFEVLLRSFGLEADPALSRIAAIIHCLDMGGLPVAEAAGIEAVLAGARSRASSDDELLDEASRLFDHLHDHYLHTHTP